LLLDRLPDLDRQPHPNYSPFESTYFFARQLTPFNHHLTICHCFTLSFQA